MYYKRAVAAFAVLVAGCWPRARRL